MKRNLSLGKLGLCYSLDFKNKVEEFIVINRKLQIIRIKTVDFGIPLQHSFYNSIPYCKDCKIIKFLAIN